MKKRIIYILGILVLIGLMFVIRQPGTDEYATQPLPELPVPPLRELAERKGVSLGMFASLKYLRERPYGEIITTEFDQVVIDGEPNWKFEDHTLRPAEDQYDFSHIDQVFEFADQNDMPVRIQHLVWGDEKWLPDWLTNGKYSDDQLLDILKKHIATVTTKYKGRVREYTVVNEAFSRKLETGGNKDWWGERLGTRYIDAAFLEARRNDPDAVLILNDFGNETEGDISNQIYKYVVSAQKRNIPIDAIGMQMHIDATRAPDKAKVVSNMKRFADLGLKVYVTEFDVNMEFAVGKDEDKLATQAQIYKDMLAACVEVGPEICPNFSFLGLIDRQSWYNGLGHTNAKPLMFNDDYSPKPAFYAVREVLQ
jgi:endo-1,4-beta-xylanase